MESEILAPGLSAPVSKPLRLGFLSIFGADILGLGLFATMLMIPTFYCTVAGIELSLSKASTALGGRSLVTLRNVVLPPTTIWTTLITSFDPSGMPRRRGG